MERYRVSELARLSGVEPRTIDFCTTQGLLEPTERSQGGHRFFRVAGSRRASIVSFSAQRARAGLESSFAHV